MKGNLNNMKSNFGKNCILFSINLLVVSLLLIGSGCVSHSSNPATTTPPSTAQITVNNAQSQDVRTISFGNIVLNSVSDQTITIKNTGSSGLTIGHINAPAAPFSIMIDNCSGKTLSVSGECTLQVRFSPTAQGSFSGSFDIPSNATNENPVSMSVSGSGKALSLTMVQTKTDQCPTVDILITVMDKDNMLQTGLTSTGFTISENGVLKDITSFSTVTISPPLSVAMLLDYSTSVISDIPGMKVAAKSFIDALQPGDDASVINFATDIQIQSFTTDTTALDQFIDTGYTGDNHATVLYDAIWSAIQETALEPTTNIRALVVLSDGRDDNATNTGYGSVKTLSEVIAYAIQNKIEIFTMGLGDVNVDVMSQLAVETGGQYIYVPSSGQLANSYQTITDILSGQYSIQYSSSSHGSGSILLDLTVVDSNGQEGIVSMQVQGCP